MTYETRDYGYRRFGAKADSSIDRIKRYLLARRAADWGFFLVGIVLGALLF
jgi:hypothetical protein